MSNNIRNPPKVFISYSWDSPEHRDRILALANRLREEGIDCQIDQYEQFPSQGWPRWMEAKIEWADFVLVICTEKYLQRFKGEEEIGQGLGVTWEGVIITQYLYQAQNNNTKFIPVVFSSQDVKFIPITLACFSRYVLNTKEGYEELYRYLTNQHSTPIPAIGKLQPLPYQERKQDFFDFFKETQNYTRDDTKQNSEPEYSASFLLNLLIEYCDEEEVKQCCFHLILKEPKYDEIVNEKGKLKIARQLMELLDRRKKLGALIDYLKKTYPDIIL
ncbi:toll/interleukin-1 receptor domain-containing protein [Nostoc sp. FACHB-280]|uniref:toll/interleukin-1 receptor domain-containing protein n=1 Tax=Nostoc sp. FACHB-280 TaxID=2692839 RepID=UPI00168AA28D|nr:toll/interleukin-1 receptor domain-containing protein [Nostoc sp. FACHB-280]MBD2497754.1 toll/interleukin-1 receptor domain-containing protein [Nostoc sp. FACHB-280]